MQNTENKYTYEKEADSISRELQDYIDNHEGAAMAVYIMDIDNFKVVDENLGRLFGDEILKETEEHILQSFKNEDIAGRLGIDKFVICQKDYESIENVKRKAEILCLKMRDAYTGEKQDYIVSMSIGISFYPEHGNTADELLECADKALIYVKKQGKDNYQIFNEDIREKMSDNRLWQGYYLQKEQENRVRASLPEFDSFGYELIKLAFHLADDTNNIQNTINLLLKKVGMHYDLDVIAVRGLIQKPRTLRYMHEYIKDKRIPNRLDSEWQYSPQDWEIFLNHFKDGCYLYYQSDGESFDISELQNSHLEFRSFCEIPIINNGEIIGCIDYICIAREVRFTESDLNTLKIFTKAISFYLLNIRDYTNTSQKLEQSDDHDALTGLLKYEVFCDKLKKAMSRW